MIKLFTLLYFTLINEVCSAHVAYCTAGSREGRKTRHKKTPAEATLIKKWNPLTLPSGLLSLQDMLVPSLHLIWSVFQNRTSLSLPLSFLFFLSVSLCLSGSPCARRGMFCHVPVEVANTRVFWPPQTRSIWVMCVTKPRRRGKIDPVL